jgi:hypothetical protein
MLLTREKIEVTEEMMHKSGLSKFIFNGSIGIPQKNGEIIWKHILEVSETDYDLIEDYFLSIK